MVMTKVCSFATAALIVLTATLPVLAETPVSPPGTRVITRFKHTKKLKRFLAPAKKPFIARKRNNPFLQKRFKRMTMPSLKIDESKDYKILTVEAGYDRDYKILRVGSMGPPKRFGGKRHR